MEKFSRENISKEHIELALSCETAGELVKLAREQGYEMTEPEAQAYLSELEDFRLDEEHLKQVAGGSCAYYYCKLYDGT